MQSAKKSISKVEHINITLLSLHRKWRFQVVCKQKHILIGRTVYPGQSHGYGPNPRGHILLASLTGNKGGNKEVMVQLVFRPATHLYSMSFICCRLVLSRI